VRRKGLPLVNQCEHRLVDGLGAPNSLVIPAVSEYSEWARDGLLLSYAQDVDWSLARSAEYVDKILRGAKPSDLPVEQATKFELVIKTAKALGLTIPPSLLDRADEVIE